MKIKEYMYHSPELWSVDIWSYLRKRKGNK